MIDGRGSHFAPELLDAFIRVKDEIRHIATQFDDGLLLDGVTD